MPDEDLAAELQCTPRMAQDDGADVVFQCAWCGTLICTPYSSLWSARDATHLGACPACQHHEWWPQTVPVGPFTRLVKIARRQRRMRQPD